MIEVVLRSDNQEDLDQIIEFAKQLNVRFELKGVPEVTDEERNAIREKLLNFKASGPSSFGDPVEWQREQRKDRKLF